MRSWHGGRGPISAFLGTRWSTVCGKGFLFFFPRGSINNWKNCYPLRLILRPEFVSGYLYLPRMY
uniref:Uncharacterized protein n=1 Tax=Arundo donax TaxID=35708 RepID=A0A0A8XWK0_ARUDO